MARKANLNLSKQVWEIFGAAGIADYLPAPELAALYLMQFRAQAANVVAPIRRLEIAVDAETRAAVPRPIKIIHAG